MTCPICQRDSAAKYRPFCSRRCSDVDLGRWLTGGYKVPADETESDDVSAPKSADDGTGRPH